MSKFIAIVAKHHRKEDISVLGDERIGNKTIRLKLLCSLIRLGDCLDVDYSRVNIDRLKHFKIEPISKFFWYGHHYLLSCDLTNLKIKLTFEFPELLQDSTQKVDLMVDHIKHDIERHIDEVYVHLDECGLRLSN